jgi:phycocyanobilin:ferredoxin oxidoreductase
MPPDTIAVPPHRESGVEAVRWPALAEEIETLLSEALDLAPAALDPALAQATGSWKGEPATIETRRCHGERVAWCRVARVHGGGLAIGNVLCVPHPALRADDRPLPVLGVDLVAVGERDAIVVADLSPMTDDRTAGSEVLARALAAGDEVARLPRIEELPGWARDSFSPAALAVRVPVESHAVAAAAVSRAARAFADLARRAVVDIGDEARTRAVRHMQQRYMERHRTEDGGLLLLARIFGNDWSRRYIRELLFPDLPEQS